MTESEREQEDTVLTVLGCGDSFGTPRAGGDWGECNPAEPRNLRLRSCLSIARGENVVVVDTGADFRAQMTQGGIRNIDALFYTHAHSDHVNGADDLRVFFERRGKPVPVYGLPETLGEIGRRFPFCFDTLTRFYPATMEPHILDVSEMGVPRQIGGIEMTPFLQKHGDGASLGLRVGDVAYSTDMSDLDDQAMETLRGVKVWIADCADFERGGGYIHCDWKKLLELNDKIGCPMVYLTHMKYTADYRGMNEILPKGYRMSFDGLKIRADGAVLSDEG